MEKRRAALRRHAAALSALALLAGGALACELPPGTRLESANYQLSFRAQPERIEIGKHFALEFAICPKPQRSMPDRVGVDAWMPEHRHGMNYRTSVTALGAGQFRAEGFLLHMPGRWEFVFQADAERLAHGVTLE